MTVAQASFIVVGHIPAENMEAGDLVKVLKLVNISGDKSNQLFSHQ